jgi:hypothetical protein
MFSGTACRGTWGGGVVVAGAIVQTSDAGFALKPDGTEAGERDASLQVTVIRTG